MRTPLLSSLFALLLLAVPALSPVRTDGAPARLALHTLWSHSLITNADSQPAIAPHGHLLYVLAGNNSSNCDPNDPVRRATLYALNPKSGAVRWSRSTTGPSRCTTAGPVVDPSGRWVYAVGLDGKAHRYNALSGAESFAGGWPHAYTLMPEVEKAAAPPTIGGRYLYITTSGFIGDAGHYQGHLVTIDLRTGQTHIFNSLCSNIHRLLGPTPGRANYCPDERSGLFGRGQGAIDPVNHNVYVVSGNGAWNGRTNWGDSVLKLDPSGAHLVDAFTPTNQASLSDADADLGSTGPALLPAVKQNGRTYHLLTQGGKGPACGTCHGVAIRLLNRDNLSGKSGPGHLGGDLVDVPSPGGCEVLTAPAQWRSPSGAIWVYYADECGMSGYRLAAAGHGKFRLDTVWSSRQGGTTPVVSGGTLYVARSGTLRAMDPATGVVRWSGNIGSLHWQYPLVAGKRLFLSDQDSRVTAFAIRK